jgi:S-adenosylmethionine:tRNA ribosyltransferase-isomerase
MRRPDNSEDAERYQTVYARNTGSAAAPTAGLHFTGEILDELEKKGIQTAWVTLEVGLGTFAPVRTENIQDHPMHHEKYNVPEETSRLVRRARMEGRKILAVGTTAVRTLEASWNGTEPESGEGSTNLFIYPGYEFQAVDLLFTNFHTPNSSLLMLVSAFCGREKLMAAYEAAIDMEYRFFSYGDAMLIR